MTSLLALDY